MTDKSDRRGKIKAVVIVALIVVGICLMGVLITKQHHSETAMQDHQMGGNASFVTNMEGDYIVVEFANGAPDDVRKAVLLTPDGERVDEPVLPGQSTVRLDAEPQFSGTGIPDGRYQVLILNQQRDTIGHASFQITTIEPDWWPL